MITELYSDDNITVKENGSGEIIILNQAQTLGIRVTPNTRRNGDIVITALGGSSLIASTYNNMPAIRLV